MLHKALAPIGVLMHLSQLMLGHLKVNIVRTYTERTREPPHDSGAWPYFAGLNMIDRGGRDLGRHRKLLLREMTLLP